MKCPNCNAEVTGRFCEYCGGEVEREKNTQNISGQNITVINNYYNTNSQNEQMEDEIEDDEDLEEELLPESKLGIVSLILSLVGFCVSFSSFGFAILIFIPTLICASISLLKIHHKRTATKISFGIFVLSIIINLF